MRWTCEKCGKTMLISDEQLVETKGVVVCPQCLASTTVEGYSTPGGDAARDSSPVNTPPKPGRAATPVPPTPPPTPRRSSPPPRPQRPSPPPTPRRTSSSGSDKPRTTRRKDAPRQSAPVSALGCLGRSIIFTLALLLCYIIVGWFFQLL